MKKLTVHEEEETCPVCLGETTILEGEFDDIKEVVCYECEGDGTVELSEVAKWEKEQVNITATDMRGFQAKGLIPTKVLAHALGLTNVIDLRV